MVTSHDLALSRSRDDVTSSIGETETGCIQRAL